MTATLDYRPLPLPPEPAAGQDTGAYGLQLFQWLITTDSCTATLSDAQLALADHAGARASAIGGLSPAVYDRLSATRHRVMLAIRTRAAYDAAGQDRGQVAGCSQGKPNLGPMAPLVDRPIVRPPSGDAVRLTPAERTAVADAIAF